MTTFNTGNPVGSVDPRDLYDNAENLDNLVNHPTKTEFQDRLGVPRKTWHGMEQDFQQFLVNSGYTGTGAGGAYEDYDADGPLTITALNQIFTKDGEFYRLKPGQAMPYSTTDWVTDEANMVAVGDAALRQELATDGGPLVSVETEIGKESLAESLRFRTLQLSSLTDISSIDVSSLQGGRFVEVIDYFAPVFPSTRFHGGGSFYWDPSRAKSQHNGVDVFSPTVPWSGSISALPDFLDGIGETNPSGSGCFVRAMTESFDLRMGGGRSDVINSPRVFERVCEAAYERGSKVAVSGGEYDFGGQVADISNPCDIDGDGTLVDLRVNLGTPSATTPDRNCSIRNINLRATSSSVDAGLCIFSARYFDIKGVSFTGITKPVRGLATTGTGFHTIGLIGVSDCGFVACGRMISLENDGNQSEYAFNDLRVSGNRAFFLKEYGVFADQLDGLIYEGNLTHFGRNTASAKSHIKLNECQWVNIGSGNTFFEGGEQAIRVDEVDTLTISGSNEIAFCGQNQPTSAILVQNSTKYLNVRISGVSAQKPTRHIIEIVAQSGASGLISGNRGVVDLRVGDSQDPTYFGPIDLASIGHSLVATSNHQNNIVVGHNEGLLIEKNGSVGALYNDNRMSSYSHDSRVRFTGRGELHSEAVVTSSGTKVCSLRSSNGTNGLISGMIFVTAKNADADVGTNDASYILHVSKSSAGQEVTQISSLGLDGGNSSNWPSFSWSMAASGDLLASPVGNTSGTFHFYISTVGNCLPE